jgi:hypothetical protein
MVLAVNVDGVPTRGAATVTLVLAPNALDATTVLAGTEYAVPPTVIVAGLSVAVRYAIPPLPLTVVV